MSDILKSGAKGDQVTALQTKLGQLGFAIKADGQFGKATLEAVEELQILFGYTVDGLVGPGTSKLIDAQVGYGWTVSSPDAVKRALEAQAKKTDKGELAGANLTRTLKPGLDGIDVRYLQRRLVALGFSLSVDGKFGKATEEAVRRLQTAFGYTVDGIVGEGTHKLINQQLGYGWNASKQTAPTA